MTLLLENPLPIWSIGAVLTTFCLLMIFARRTLTSIIALVAVVSLTLLLALAERLVITESEQVEAAVEHLINALETNDLAGVLALVDPGAIAVRTDAEALMPQVKIKDAGATALRVELDESVDPLHATSYFRGRVDGIHTRLGGRLFYFDQVEIDWQKSGDRWLIIKYRAFHRGRQIDAVKSLRRNRRSR